MSGRTILLFSGSISDPWLYYKGWVEVAAIVGQNSGRVKIWHDDGRVKIMPRKPADLRISLKRRGGKTYRIELIRQSLSRRFTVRRNGKISETMPEATASQIADRIRQWIVANEDVRQ